MVRTPDATVVDLGTEFGIAVERNGLSDVEVFAGRVEVGLGADAEPTTTKQVVLAGKAIHVWSPTASGRPLVETAAAGLMHFVRSLPSAAKPASAVAGDASAMAAERFGIPEAAAELIGPLHQPKGRLVYLDLAPYTNELLSKPKGTTAGNDLLELGTGEQTLAGVRFRIDDSTIQLGSKRLSKEPSQVEAIPVQRRVATLYLLHAAQWGDTRLGVAEGTNIGHYQIHYTDGSQATIPIVCGEDVRDWWSYDHEKRRDARTSGMGGAQCGHQGSQDLLASVLERLGESAPREDSCQSRLRFGDDCRCAVLRGNHRGNAYAGPSWPGSALGV